MKLGVFKMQNEEKQQCLFQLDFTLQLVDIFRYFIGIFVRKFHHLETEWQTEIKQYIK